MAPLPRTDGHLVVLCGFDRGGRPGRQRPRRRPRQGSPSGGPTPGASCTAPGLRTPRASRPPFPPDPGTISARRKRGAADAEVESLPLAAIRVPYPVAPKRLSCLGFGDPTHPQRRTNLCRQASGGDELWGRDPNAPDRAPPCRKGYRRRASRVVFMTPRIVRTSASSFASRSSSSRGITANRRSRFDFGVQPPHHGQWRTDERRLPRHSRGSRVLKVILAGRLAEDDRNDAILGGLFEIAAFASDMPAQRDPSFRQTIGWTGFCRGDPDERPVAEAREPRGRAAGRRRAALRAGEGRGHALAELRDHAVLRADRCGVDAAPWTVSCEPPSERSFERVSVDGQLSTNDSVFAIAGGRARA